MRSIMHDKKSGYCYLCARLHGDYSRKDVLQEHHVIFGRGNRRLSEKCGLKVYLCVWHHTEGKEAVHKNMELRRELEQEAQLAFLQNHTQQEWMNIFGRNFIREECHSHLGFMGKTDTEDGADLKGITFFEDV